MALKVSISESEPPNPNMIRQIEEGLGACSTGLGAWSTVAL